MKRTERIVIYGILTLLCLLGLNSLMTLPTTPAGAAVAAMLNDLGPASRVTLSDPAGDNLVLFSRDSRLSWSDAPFSRAYSFAFVHARKPIAKLMQSEPYEEERQLLRDELKREYDQRFSEREAIEERLGQLDPSTPEHRELLARHRQMYEEFLKFSAEAEARGQQLDADHLERAFREVVNAVHVVAQRKDIDIVYRFIPTDEPFESTTAESAMRSIQFRPALVYPESLDITPEVMEEMSLPVE